MTPPIPGSLPALQSVPPRGVLFGGLLGIGKTLLVRALPASFRSNGTGISFFVRKDADALSKWVGEAER